jgi:hypothetical protein
MPSRTRASPAYGSPYQLAVWHHDNVGELAEGVPWWARAPSTTEAGDRQLVIEGQGRGLIAILDFSGRAIVHPDSSTYRARATLTRLRPVPEPELLAHPLIADRLTGDRGKARQGSPIWLTAEEWAAFEAVAGPMPPVRPPDRAPDFDDLMQVWQSPTLGPPEKQAEGLAAAKRPKVRRLYR